MKIIASVKRGWECKRLALFLYLINLGFGLFLGLQFYNILVKGGANFWHHLGWKGNWDHALIRDFFANHWNALEVLWSEVGLLIPFFIAVNVFVTGGVLYCGNLKGHNWSSFWKGGSVLFFSYLLNFFLYLALITMALFVTIIPGITWAIHYLEFTGSEKGSFLIVLIALALFLMIIIYLINASSVSKVNLIKDDRNVWRSFRYGLSFGWANKCKLLGRFLFYLIMVVVCLVLVRLVKNFIGLSNWPTLMFTFVIQQSFIFARSLFRIMYLYSVQDLVLEKGFKE